MLLCNDRLDDVCEIVHIWESLDTEDDIVESNLLLGRFIRGLYHYRELAAVRDSDCKGRTVARLESLVAEFVRPSLRQLTHLMYWKGIYLNETPYCATVWKFAFQTRVTSHALVA